MWLLNVAILIGHVTYDNTISMNFVLGIVMHVLGFYDHLEK